VLYATGLRVSELVGLTFKQLDLRRGVVRPLGKGSKERVVPMVAPAVEKLQLYLEQARPRLLKDRESPYVFINHRGGRLSRQGFWKLLKQYALKAGVKTPPPYPGIPLPPTCCPGTICAPCKCFGPCRPGHDPDLHPPGRRAPRWCTRRRIPGHEYP
jgi:hypothetical protein